MRTKRRAAAVTAIVVAALLVRPATRSAASSPAAPESPPPVHLDAPATERETLRVVRAFLRDDPETAQAALERLDASCRRLAPEEDERFGAGARTLDQALHRVVGNAIEYAGAGQTERAFDEFVWAQRTCRRCHALAREQGLLPAKGPLWEDSVTNNRVETTPPAPGAP